MKRFLSILLVAVMALGLMATSAFAASPAITVEANDVTVTLKATDVTFQSCLATINFDHTKLTLKDVKAGEVTSPAQDVSEVKSADGITDDGKQAMFAWNADNNGKAMIAYASAADKSANGIMFTLTFELKDGVTEANVGAEVVFYDENNKDGDKIVPIETSTTNDAVIVSASGVLYGDVNNDGKVNPADRAALARYLAKWPDYKNINLANADVNGDGQVNPADRAFLARHFAKWPAYATLGQPPQN